MGAERNVLEKIRALLGAGRYRIRLHAVRHMIEEGFDEENVLKAIGGASRILEIYSHEMRCLLLGYFTVSEKARQPLHIVCDYSNPKVVDIVTAYLPQRPWWTAPGKRGRLV
jgi:hypothetical protein